MLLRLNVKYSLEDRYIRIKMRTHAIVVPPSGKELAS